MERIKITVLIWLGLLTVANAYLMIKLKSTGDPNISKMTVSPSLVPSPIPSILPETLISSPSPSPSPVASPKAASITSTTTTVAPFQPQIIYFGPANTTQTSWTESGLEVRINSTDYPNGVSAVFEAGLSIVNGEAWARLKNKTTGAIMSVTEIYNTTNTSTWKSSPAFWLHSGNNVYALELKSSSGETAFLSGARIRISK